MGVGRDPQTRTDRIDSRNAAYVCAVGSSDERPDLPHTVRVGLGRIWSAGAGTFARIIAGTGAGGDLQAGCAATSQQRESGYVIESITLSAEGSPKEGSPSRRSARSLTLPVISWHGTE